MCGRGLRDRSAAAKPEMGEIFPLLPEAALHKLNFENQSDQRRHTHSDTHTLSISAIRVLYDFDLSVFVSK